MDPNDPNQGRVCLLCGREVPAGARRDHGLGVCKEAPIIDEHGERIEVDQPAIFDMMRGGKKVAQVVALPNGKCIVAWPTSTIVYDTERSARAVHIQHMGERGEPTSWRLVWSTEGFARGFVVCYQDRCEGVPEGSGPTPPDYIPDHQRADYERGYRSKAMDMWGADWSPMPKAVPGTGAEVR